jgi:hypothetical protein
MTSDDELRGLRRAAFGRSSTPDERRQAAERLAALDAAAQQARAEQVQADDEVPTATAAPAPESAASSAAPESEPHARRSIALIWVLPIVLAALVLGVIAGRALESGSVPRERATASDAAGESQQVRGDLAAARTQLAGPHTGGEAFPDPVFVEKQGLESVTLIGDLHPGDLHITVWGATNQSDDICLIAGVPDGVFAAQCVNGTEFSQHGITLGFNGFEVSWNGVSSSAVPSTSGPDPATVRKSVNQSTVPVVGWDSNVPVGDVAAARKLFATAPTEQVRYPHPALLRDIRQSTVRYLGGDQELVRAWVAEDREGKICLLLDRNGSGASHCSTVSDFVSRGIAFGIGEFSASWNGRDWASSSPNGYRQGTSAPAGAH